MTEKKVKQREAKERQKNKTEKKVKEREKQKKDKRIKSCKNDGEEGVEIRSFKLLITFIFFFIY
jgi:hypothetical protein